MKDIETLLNKYFEGETTCEEEQYLTYSLSAAAAAILLLVGISGIYRHLSPAPANYVIIDGKEYTDVHLIREQAMVAFRDVSLSEEEVFATLFDE